MDIEMVNTTGSMGFIIGTIVIERSRSKLTRELMITHEEQCWRTWFKVTECCQWALFW